VGRCKNKYASINRQTFALNSKPEGVDHDGLRRLLAVNCLPHPGEKRLVDFAKKFCAKRPAEMEAQIEQVIAAVADLQAILPGFNKLVDEMEKLLRAEKLV
jgi:hypothetical protein